MKYLHTMVRVSDLEKSLDFYCAKLGLVELRRVDVSAGRYTLVFLAAPGDVCVVTAGRSRETGSTNLIRVVSVAP